MLRLLLYIIVLITAAVFLARLVDIPGDVNVQWMGWQIQTTPLFLLCATGAVLILLLSVFWLFDRLFSLPKRYRNQKRIEYHEQGLSALTEAIAALAVSDVSNAKKLTKRAEKLLGSTPITHLLTAQLARLEGDEATASQHLKRLLDFKETHFLAARGLLEQARKSGDVDTAVAYAQEAGSIRPDSSFAALSMIDLYTHQKRWQQALEVLRRAQKHHALSNQEALRYKALIEYEHAHYLYEHDDHTLALTYAKNAHKVLPDMVPAALLLANLYAEAGKKRNIVSVLERTWEVSPHPALIAFYRQFLITETAEKRLQLIEKLVSSNDEDIESYLAIADAALDAGQYEKARTNAKLALDILETTRACELMSRIEEAEQRPEKAIKWRERATKTPVGAAWTCESCKEIVPEWSLHCPECDSFDSIHWRINRVPFVNARIIPTQK